MAILQLKQDQFMVVNGWYGKCHDAAGNLVDDIDCPEFDLTAHTSKIKSVYQVKSDNTVHSYDSSAQSSTNDFTKLKCGGSYLIYLQKGTGTLDVPHFVASYPDGATQGRITDNCETEPTGPSDFQLDLTSLEISEEVDEGYNRLGTTDYDANEYSLISNATGVQTLQLSANSNILEYSTNGTSWTQLTTSVKNIASADIANLKVRLRSGLTNTSSGVVAISLVGIPENSIYNNLEKTITITVTINPVSLSATKAITETIEEGASGAEYSFDISYSALKTISVSGGTDAGYQISTSAGGTYVNNLVFDSSVSAIPASPIKIYVKLTSAMPATNVSNTFVVSGVTRRSSSINNSSSVTANATVAPRPQISSLSVNPTTLAVSISFTNRNNYGGDHWHYDVKKKSDNSIIVPTKMPGFNDSVTLDPDQFTEATTFVLTAYIVTNAMGHPQVVGSDTKTAEFTIAENPAFLNINKSGVSGVVDIDDPFQTTSVNITSNNLTNIRYEPGTFTNWEFASAPNSTGFSIRLKSALKDSDLSSGPRVLPQETFTITGDVGPRDNSGHTTKSVTFTMDQTIVDNAEFSISGNLTVTDTRNYGTSIPEFGPFTINSDAVELSSSTLNNWEVKIGTGTWTKSPNFAIANNGTTFKVRQSNISVGTYNETLTITPTAKSSDIDASDNPSAIDITLNGKINANVASLVWPGNIQLLNITSGGTFSSKSFTVSGNLIENIQISGVSSNWSVTPLSPSVGDVVTVAYIGDNETTGERSGSFTISASAVTGATLNVTSYNVDLKVTINPKTSSITTTPTSITLDDIVSGQTSNTKNLKVDSANTSDVKISSIPSGWVVTNGATTLNNNDSIGTSATLTISISDVNTKGNRSGTLILSGTPSANSVFSGGNTKNVSLNATVTGLSTSLSIDPTSVTNAVNQYDPILPAATKITITQTYLESVTISGGSSNKYQVSTTENGIYNNDLTLTMPANTFYVKLMSTDSSSDVTTYLTISGQMVSNGASNPTIILLKCTTDVTAFTAGITLIPSSITETYDQNATATAQSVTANLDDISSLDITASGKYSVSETETGTFSSSVSLSNPGTSTTVWVKCNDTSTAGIATGTITFDGTHTLGNDSTTETLTCSATITEADTSGGGGDCCEGMTKIPTNTGGVASILMQSAPGYSVCCKPKMQFTLEPPNNYVFYVQLNGGGVIGQIQVAQRTGGISSTTFDSTVFIVEDPDGNFYEADLGGLTGGQINFLPKDCGGGGTGNDDCCANQTEIPTNTGGVASILMQSAPGYILCCDPKMQFTLEPPNNYVFYVQLNGGGVMGQIQVAQRTGGISSTTFNSTVFTIKDADGICYTADLGGMTGGPINFTT